MALSGVRTLVKDINTTPIDRSLIEEMVDVGGVLYFSARDNAHGLELWRSDGTPDGTALAFDIRPGTRSSNPRDLTDIGGTLYFTTDSDREYRRELWKSDGTPAGTVLLKADLPSFDGLPFWRTELNELLYFAVPDSGQGRGGAIWRSDGTPQGTVLFNQHDSGPSHPSWLTNVNGTLYYALSWADDDYELWKSDGSSAGTVQITGLDGVSGLASANSTLFFVGDDGDTTSLWRSDGTPEGTIRLRPRNPDNDYDYSDSAGNVIAVGSVVFFAARNCGSCRIGLYRSNGSPTHPERVFSFDEYGYLLDHQFTAVGASLYWVDGGQLWKANAAGGAAVLVKDFQSGTTIPTLAGLTDLNGALYFAVDNQLWRSDGTTSGTVLAVDAIEQSLAYSFVASGDRLFAHFDTTQGIQFWTTDGTATGTSTVTTIRATGTGDAFNLGPLEGSPEVFYDAGGTLYFIADDGQSDLALWKSNATEAGTVAVKRFPRAAWQQFKEEYAGEVFLSPMFREVNGLVQFHTHDTGLWWTTDGTELGTIPLVADDPVESVSLGNVQYFATTTAIWMQVGSAGAPVLLGTVASAHDLTLVGEGLYFVAPDGLWYSDGTPQGAFLLTSVTADALTPANGILYFRGTNAENGSELWKSDGTIAGTEIVKDIQAGGDSSVAPTLAWLNGRLYFVADDGDQGWWGDQVWQLWSSDGTELGTSLYLDIYGDYPTIVDADRLAVAGGKLFFLVEDTLWRTDGTALGTFGLEYVGSDSPGRFTVVGDRLFYDAEDDGIWLSDGTTTGTIRVADSGDQSYAISGGKVYIVGDDGYHGSELWTVSSPPGDLDGDFRVNRTDLAMMARNYGRATGATALSGDLNGDGRIGLIDLVMLRNELDTSIDGPAVSPSSPVRRGSPRPSAPVAADAAIVSIVQSSTRSTGNQRTALRTNVRRPQSVPQSPLRHELKATTMPTKLLGVARKPINSKTRALGREANSEADATLPGTNSINLFEY